MYLAVMVGEFVKQVVREWCPSTTGPLLQVDVEEKKWTGGRGLPSTLGAPDGWCSHATQRKGDLVLVVEEIESAFEFHLEPLGFSRTCIICAQHGIFKTR